jgi:hypothetical protein
MNTVVDEYCTLHDDCIKDANLSRVCMRARMSTPDGKRLTRLRGELKASREVMVAAVKDAGDQQSRAVLAHLINMLNQLLEI